MKSGLRKILEIILIIGIVGLSIVIFLRRDRIQNVSNISYLGVFLLCLLTSSTVLLPSLSLMIAASCALVLNPLLVALFAACGLTVGELVGYTFGTVSKDLSPNFQKIIDKLAARIHKQSLLVFIFAVLPMPLFDLVGIYSGGIKMNLGKFCLACFAGKFIKMLVYAKGYDIMNWALSYLS